MSVPNFPVVNLGNFYSYGCVPIVGTITTLTITPGQLRDTTDKNDIVVHDTLSINTAIQGAGGLDTGTIAVSTFYAVYVVSNSTRSNEPASFNYVRPAGLISANLTTPLLPTNCDMYRRVGYILTDGAGHILPFHYEGAGTVRTLWYDTQIEVLAGGVSAGYAAVGAGALALAVPPIPNANLTGNVILTAEYTPTAGGDLTNLKVTGSASVDGNVIISGATTAVVQTLQVVCPYNHTPSLDYKTVGALNLFVAGFVDDLNATLL